MESLYGIGEEGGEALLRGIGTGVGVGVLYVMVVVSVSNLVNTNNTRACSSLSMVLLKHTRRILNCVPRTLVMA